MFAMVGKMAISGSFMMIFVYQTEIFPTEVRTQGQAVTLVAEQLGGTTAPYIASYLVSRGWVIGAWCVVTEWWVEAQNVLSKLDFKVQLCLATTKMDSFKEQIWFWYGWRQRQESEK